MSQGCVQSDKNEEYLRTVVVQNYCQIYKVRLSGKYEILLGY
jgi:hypothetical protein